MLVNTISLSQNYPQNSMAWYYKGDALKDLNKSEEAKKAYKKAIEINPQIRSLER